MYITHKNTAKLSSAKNGIGFSSFLQTRQEKRKALWGPFPKRRRPAFLCCMSGVIWPLHWREKWNVFRVCTHRARCSATSVMQRIDRCIFQSDVHNKCVVTLLHVSVTQGSTSGRWRARCKQTLFLLAWKFFLGASKKKRKFLSTRLKLPQISFLFAPRNTLHFFPDSLVADKIGECSSDSHRCTVCVNDTRSAFCFCNPGFASNGTECLNIDECASDIHNCSSFATCHDYEGSYVCSCNEGYRGDGETCHDINECDEKTDACGRNSICVNYDGSFECPCEEGFVKNGTECQNEDECATTADLCGEFAHCVDTEGSYECVCNEGFSADGQTCNDIDECQEGTYSCGNNSYCVNQHGYYECKCNAGFAKNISDSECYNENECADATSSPCGQLAYCIDTEGSYDCVCNEGFSGDGQNCNDIDECSAGLHVCPANAHAHCTNTPGSYVCNCDEGYTGDGIDCSRIPACNKAIEERLCPTNSQCVENEVSSSFDCVCNPGFSKEGNECVKTVHCNSGSYLTTDNSCAECPVHFYNSFQDNLLSGCIPCPTWYVTTSTGSTTISQCFRKFLLKHLLLWFSTIWKAFLPTGLTTNCHEVLFYNSVHFLSSWALHRREFRKLHRMPGWHVPI